MREPLHACARFARVGTLGAAAEASALVLPAHALGRGRAPAGGVALLLAVGLTWHGNRVPQPCLAGSGDGLLFNHLTSRRQVYRPS